MLTRSLNAAVYIHYANFFPRPGFPNFDKKGKTFVNYCRWQPRASFSRQFYTILLTYTLYANTI